MTQKKGGRKAPTIFTQKDFFRLFRDLESVRQDLHKVVTVLQYRDTIETALGALNVDVSGMRGEFSGMREEMKKIRLMVPTVPPVKRMAHLEMAVDELTNRVRLMDDRLVVPVSRLCDLLLPPDDSRPQIDVVHQKSGRPRKVK